MKRSTKFAAAVFLAVAGQVTPLVAQRPSDFGTQWIRNHPFSLMGLTGSSTWFDADEYKAAELNTFLCWDSVDQLLPIAVAGQLPWHDAVPQTALTQEVQDAITAAMENT